ncbi:E3 ubiquitin-protein ligase CHFR isoform X2 [Hyperolius riggenbachi]|uniref:E3 ubiquitin-protein ligase CHFR isoform X2 n=1 Tax=Hyperolius riggenbachi TaxID=752182 RepID=UPI0035A303FD
MSFSESMTACRGNLQEQGEELFSFALCLNFQNYLASRGLTWKDLLHESLAAVQRGLFLLPDNRISGSTVLCYFCGLRNFRDLSYQYRQNIPPAELSVAVTSRPNCYWGRNCRTQVKAHHAMKFNHICEQTRFKN